MEWHLSRTEKKKSAYLIPSEIILQERRQIKGAFMWISLVSWSGKEALQVVFIIKGFITGTGALMGMGGLDEGMKFWKAAAGETESHQLLQPKILM